MPASYSETVLVTGANGQVGSELRDVSIHFPQYRFLFTDRQTLPIEDRGAIESFFEKTQIHYCINCAAYTAVDKAEADHDAAFLVNGSAVGDLASLCKAHQTKFIHISTDYVYDGNKNEPLKEEDRVAPLNVYGLSKLQGEELALNHNPDTLIIRTSWVYSTYGHNFVKTMLRLLVEKKELNVVADQLGSPTYAADLASVIMTFVSEHSKGNQHQGIFNFSNYGITSWFQFAQFIKEKISSVCTLHPVNTEQYPTPALRPKYSVLDTSKIRTALAIEIPFWKDSVAKCVEMLLK